MRTEKTGIVLHIRLPKGFMDEVSDAMDDEFDVACGKWGVRLNSDDRKTVIQNSLDQLGRKVFENAKIHWDFGNVINVRLTTSRTGEINLPPKKRSPEASKSVIRMRGGWEFDDEDRDEAISLLEFSEFYRNLVKVWARTAVFYGVGSYVR